MGRVRSWKRSVILAALIGILLAGSAFGAEPTPAASAWEEDFAKVCASTDRAMTLQPGELRQLIAECDRLKPFIEALPPTPRKIHLRRLEMTRDLFLFTLENRKMPPE